MTAGQAELRTLRLLIGAVAISTILSALVGTVVADPSGRVALPPWHPALTVAAYGLLVVVGVAAPWMTARMLRFGAGAGVVVFAAALVAFAPASGLLSGGTSAGTVPWALTGIGGIALAAVVAGGARLGWVVIASWAATLASYRLLLGGYTLGGFANDAQALLSAVALCVVGGTVLRAARELDEAVAGAEAAVEREATERGRLAARAKAAAFIHDEVLAALRGAADGLPLTADAVRRQARRATGIVEDGGGDADWLESLREAAGGAGAAFDATGVRDAVFVDDQAARALVNAARQALDNSLRHAGECRRWIRVAADGDAVRVEVGDDGVGFDPGSVAADRLGIDVSIVGTMAAVEGGTASLETARGEGVVVHLAWQAPDVGSHLGDVPRGALMVGMRGIAVLFVATQVLVAAAAAVWGGSPVTAAAALAGILSAAEIVRRAPGQRLSVRRAAVTTTVLGVVVAAALLATPAPIMYGTGWFLPAAGFVLVFVALRGRPWIAVAGAVALIGVLAVDALARGGAPVQLMSAAVRTAVVVGLGATVSIVLVRLRRSTIAAADRALQSARRRAWGAASQRELDAHAVEVDRFARPLLERVADGELLDEGGRALARAIEGRLRDGYRGGRLLRAATVDAAMAARLRGVDVLLLDDAGDESFDESHLAAVTTWMGSQLALAEQRFVGRLLPPGRAHQAQALVDGRVSAFGESEPDARHGASSIFHGE
ncbi:ATP-binding protein [Microbacterium sp. P06]|uniref:ATP-binding protein n=1 Tax=Microbacterium sp. P06 TaxID=3366949 RepID=UPI003744D3AD